MMAERKIHITEHDRQRLEKLISDSVDFGMHPRKDVVGLSEELARASIVAPEEIPADVVTMNSKVVLRDMGTSEQMTYTLSFPNEADISMGSISVLAPIGTAILGYSIGDEVEWPVPSGVRHIRIEDIVYQPEASGHFDR